MRVIIDNSIVKEIVNYLVKDKAIIDDFTKFTDLTGFGDYHVTSYGIDNLRTDFYRNENTYKCHNPSILDDLGLPNNACFNRLIINNIETFVDYKEKSNNELNIYLQKTYFKAIKDLLKIPDCQRYHDFIYISPYSIDEFIIKEFENIKFRQFNSFRSFVEQYCNGYKYLEAPWVKNAIDSIDISDLDDPDAIEPNELFPYVEEIDSMLNDTGINKYSRYYEGLSFSEIEILDYSNTTNNHSVYLFIDGTANISTDCTIQVGYKIGVSMPKGFIDDDELGCWDEYLSEILRNSLSPMEGFFDDGYCEMQSELNCEINITVKDKSIIGFHFCNFR